MVRFDMTFRSNPAATLTARAPDPLLILHIFLPSAVAEEFADRMARQDIMQFADFPTFQRQFTPNCNKRSYRHSSDSHTRDSLSDSRRRRRATLVFSYLLAKMRWFWLLILQNPSNGVEFMHRLMIC